jgi:hypothetical protein
MSAERLVAGLGEEGWTGWIAPCPAHDDHKPESVTELTHSD